MGWHVPSSEWIHQIDHQFWRGCGIPTFGNGCLSAIGGGKQRSRFDGWAQLSAEAAPGPTEYRQRHPVQ